MSRELELIGLGAAVEELAGPRPETPGDGPKHAAAHAECLNCGAHLHGRFCHACGQSGDDHHRSIFHLLWEAVEGMFHLDGRLARTVPLLFLKPGRLARDHFEGRRQRHVPPFRLFLVTLLLFMLALEVRVHDAGHHPAAGQGGHAAPAATSQTPPPAVLAPGVTVDGVAPPRAPESPQLDGLDVSLPTADARAAGATYAAGHAVGQLARGQRDTLQTIDDTALGDSRFAKWIVSKAKAAGVSPAYFTSTMFGWAHRLAVLLLPVFSLLLVCCYFYRRKFYVYDHLVVSMQFLSFVFLISAVAWVLPEPLRGVAVLIAIVWTPVNLFLILRGAYGSSVIGAVVKTFFLWNAALIVFALLMLGIVALALGEM